MASHNFGKTQRGHILDLLRGNQNLENGAVRTDDIELKDSKIYDNGKEVEKQKCDISIPKAIILGITLVALLVGIIVVVIKIKKPDSKSDSIRGKVTSDPDPTEECKKIDAISLGEEIIIKCSINNDTWKGDTLPGRVVAVHNNPVLNISVSCTRSGKNVTCKPGTATCSSLGRFDIKFFNSSDRNAKVAFMKSVTVKFKAPSLTTSITQEYQDTDDTSDNRSVFHLTCTYDSDCNAYEMQFRGVGHIIADPLECSKSSYSDKEGHSMKCNATVPDGIISRYGRQLYCDLKDEQGINRSSEFLLPSCSDYNIHNASCNRTTTDLFNCTSNTTGKVNPGKICELIEACYPLRHFPSQNGTCHLGWCRIDADNHQIDYREDSLFVPLCNQ